MGTVAPAETALVVGNLNRFTCTLSAQHLEILIEKVDARQKSPLQKKHQPLLDNVAIPLCDDARPLEHAFRNDGKVQLTQVVNVQVIKMVGEIFFVLPDICQDANIKAHLKQMSNILCNLITHNITLLQDKRYMLMRRATVVLCKAPSIPAGHLYAAHHHPSLVEHAPHLGQKGQRVKGHIADRVCKEGERTDRLGADDILIRLELKRDRLLILFVA